MRIVLALALVTAVPACGKTDAQRDEERMRDVAAKELEALKQTLATLEMEADELTRRTSEIDDQLLRVADELAQTTEPAVREAIKTKLEKLRIDREDVERKLDELRAKLPK